MYHLLRRLFIALATVPACSGRVLVGNWLEEQTAGEAKAKQPFVGISTSRATYTPEHKYGAEIAQKAPLHFRRTAPGQSSFLAHRYDAAGHCTPPCLASVYQLNHGLHQHGRVQNQLWQGFKENDMGVPLSIEKHDLVDAKHRQLILAPLQSKFQTSYEEAARSITGCGDMRREQCRPCCEGGQPAQVGRKATGSFVNELDMTYQKLHLRK